MVMGFIKRFPLRRILWHFILFEHFLLSREQVQDLFHPFIQILFRNPAFLYSL